MIKWLEWKNKGQASNTKSYIGKNTWTKTQGPELEDDTDLKGRCSDLEVYIFYLGPRSSDEFARTMKDLGQ